MVLIQDKGFQVPLMQGIERARRNSRRVLVSVTQLVQWIDPLQFFSAGQARFNGERVFWSDQTGRFSLVGLGTAFSFEYKTGNEYQKLEQEWEATVADGVISPAQSVPGTGPVLMGGFSFDPARMKTSLWKNFADTRFILPKLMLSIVAGEAWLTINLFLQPDEDIDALTEQLQQEQESFFRNESKKVIRRTAGDCSFSEPFSETWKAAVAELASEIREGEGILEKVVLARELRVSSPQPFSAVEILRQLQKEQVDSFIFAFESGEDCFLGASPERLVKREGDYFLSTCLAGSIRRGQTPEEDRELGRQLLQDRKNLEEHQVVVKMIQQAMRQLCSSVDVPRQPVLYKARDIQHLYTPVKGVAKDEASILTIVEQLHPTPALGGFPREIALSKIRDKESMERGWYGAPVGWIDYRGDGEFAVAIRSGLLQGDEASLFAGCGIIRESDPESEFTETQLKFRPMLSALGVEV